MQIGEGGGQDPTAYRQDGFGGQDRLVEVACDAVERGQEQVAKRMARQSLAFPESVLEQPREQILVIGQSHDAAADISRRQDTEIPTQAT